MQELYATLKNVHHLEPHKKGCSSWVLKCEISSSYDVKEKDPKEHLKEKHEELYPKESVGPKNQKQRNSFRTENCTNVNLFKCDGCEYTFKRTNEPEDHYQDYHCEEYNLNLSYRIGLKSVVKQVSLNNDLKNNNVKFSTDVPATIYSHDFACENCNNSIVDKTHPKKHMENYHKARMKDTEEANNIMKRIMNSHKLTEGPEDRGLYSYKNLVPLDNICSNCEIKWATTLNLQHHGNIEHVELLALIRDKIPQNDRRVKKHMLKDYSSKEKLTWHNCGNLCDEETDLRCHITNKHKAGNKSPSFMGSIITMICRMIETDTNKLWPSWAKLSHN